MKNRLEKAPDAGAGKPWILREAVDNLHGQGRGGTHNIGMICRDHCAACCIAPSISSPIPGMPDGKPAGVRCIQLDEQDRCKIFGRPERPAVCGSLQPSEMMCGESREQAMRWLGWMEAETAPSAAGSR